MQELLLNVMLRWKHARLRHHGQLLQLGELLGRLLLQNLAPDDSCAKV
jgi:hypothetical protein